MTWLLAVCIILAQLGDLIAARQRAAEAQTQANAAIVEWEMAR